MSIPAGYSGTPLARKLGIKEGSIVAVMNPPPDYLELLEPLPSEVTIIDARSANGSDTGADVVHLFTNDRDELFAMLSTKTRQMKQNGAIWVSWYKRAAKLPTEITEDTV